MHSTVLPKQCTSSIIGGKLANKKQVLLRFLSVACVFLMFSVVLLGDFMMMMMMSGGGIPGELHRDDDGGGDMTTTTMKMMKCKM